MHSEEIKYVDKWKKTNGNRRKQMGGKEMQKQVWKEVCAEERNHKGMQVQKEILLEEEKEKRY